MGKKSAGRKAKRQAALDAEFTKGYQQATKDAAWQIAHGSRTGAAVVKAQQLAGTSASAKAERERQDQDAAFAAYLARMASDPSSAFARSAEAALDRHRPEHDLTDFRAHAELRGGTPWPR